MNRTVLMSMVAALTALVLTAAFLLGARRSGNDVAAVGVEGTPVPLAAPTTTLSGRDMNTLPTSVEAVRQVYQQQLDVQVEQIRQMYQRQLEEQLEQLRAEYERQLESQLQQGYQQPPGQEMSPQREEALRQAYEAQIRALQAAWQQREQAYQAQLQEAIRRLEAANAQIQALQQTPRNASTLGPVPASDEEAPGAYYSDRDDDDDERWEYRRGVYQEEDDGEWEDERDDD